MGYSTFELERASALRLILEAVFYEQFAFERRVETLARRDIVAIANAAHRRANAGRVNDQPSVSTPSTCIESAASRRLEVLNPRKRDRDRSVVRCCGPNDASDQENKLPRIFNRVDAVAKRMSTTVNAFFSEGARKSAPSEKAANTIAAASHCRVIGTLSDVARAIPPPRFRDGASVEARNISAAPVRRHAQ